MAGPPLSLLLVCSAKIFFSDLLGTIHPDAGYCAGASGFDCVCPEGEESGSADGTLASGLGSASSGDSGGGGGDPFRAWFSGLDGVMADAEAKDPTLASKVREPFVINGKLIDNGCEDRNENCTWWAEIGECQKNPGYLIYECPKSCNMCRHQMPRHIKCQRDPAEPPILQSPGGLNKMMSRIAHDPEIKRKFNTTVLLRDPWILQFDNFATREEWEWIANEVKNQFEESTVVGTMDENGVIERQKLSTRTSSNAWCNLDSCAKSAVHTGLQDRLIEILGPTVGRHHMESLQVLRYKVGTFYHPHHDTITDQIDHWSGPRMFTAFIYFNDKPTGGGETEFTHIQPMLKVKPKLGRMILWPSQRDSDSRVPDERTTHQACNVTEGTKEAANLWVHLYDYQTPSFLGCSG